ncbi:hypothetical protein [Spirosoma spitsbergense]|uniref:hypothetical protein n=1 Tax=Spirosoma spitsbergense TaxID=431554 RepID=UPI00036A5F5B|nr:hypothetical protein [Spirosoma spitsbergense]
MSLQSQLMLSIPRQTVRVARAAFPQGNRYMQLRDTLGTIYDDKGAFAVSYKIRHLTDLTGSRIDN